MPNGGGRLTFLPNIIMGADLVQFAVNAIEAYLEAHPDSADTVEGVHQWWIQWPDIAESITVTAAALLQLQQAHRIDCRRIGNREIWRLPRAPQP
jgi:hypothetical protein